MDKKHAYRSVGLASIASQQAWKMVHVAVHQGIFNVEGVSEKTETFPQGGVPIWQTRQANPKLSAISQIDQEHNKKIVRFIELLVRVCAHIQTHLSFRLRCRYNRRGFSQ